MKNRIKIKNTILRKLLKGLFIFLIAVISLYFLLKIAILLPVTQEKLKSVSISAIEDQVDAAASIEQFNFRFPKRLVINNTLISKKNTDTLFYLEELSVNIRILPLLRKSIALQDIRIINGKGDFGRLLNNLKESDPGKEPQEQEKSSGSWSFAINAIEIESCFFRFRDEQELGLELILDIGEFHIKPGGLDFSEVIEVNALDMSNTFVSYESLLLPEIEEDTTATTPLKLSFGRINLAHSGFTYIDTAGSIIFNTDAEKLDIDRLLVDLARESIQLGEAKINAKTGIISLPGTDTTQVVAGESASLNWGSSLWRISGDKLNFDDFGFFIDYPDEPDPFGHFNSNHAGLENLNGEILNFRIDKDTLILQIENLSGQERNGLNIKNLSGTLDQQDSLFIVDGLNLTTENASYSIDFKTTLSPTDYSMVENMFIDLDLDITGKNLNDIDYFSPISTDTSLIAESITDVPFGINFSGKGSIEHFSIQKLAINYFDSTYVKISGSDVMNLDKPDSIEFNILINDIFISGSDLNASLAEPIPDTISYFPDYIRMSGILNGSGNHYSFFGDIISNLARIDVEKIKAYNETAKGLEANVAIEVRDSMDIFGYDLKNGHISITASLAGNTLFDVTGTTSIAVDSLDFNDYSYKNIFINAEIDGGNFLTNIESVDTNFAVKSTISGELEPDTMVFNSAINVSQIDLYSLNFQSSEFKVSTRSRSEIRITGDSDYDIQIDIDSLGFQFSDTLYSMHPIALKMNTSNSSTRLDLKSFYYFLEFETDRHIDHLGDSFGNYTNLLLSGETNDTVHDIIPMFRIEGELIYPEAFARLLFPDFPVFDKLTINGTCLPDEDHFDLLIALPYLENSSVRVDSFYFSTTGGIRELTYESNLDVAVSDLLKGKVGLSGELKQTDLTSRITYTDSFDDTYLDLGIETSFGNDTIILRILDEPLIFSYDNWEIDPANRIIIREDQSKIENFELTDAKQYFKIESIYPDNDPAINLTLKNFGLGSIEQLLALDTMVKGTASADIQFEKISSDPVISGKLNFENVSALGFDGGKVDINDLMIKSGFFRVNLTAINKEQQIFLDGTLDENHSSSPIQFDLKVNRIALAQFDYLLSDFTSGIQGYVSSDLSVTGEVDNPVASGFIKFDEASAGIIALNNSFKLGNSPITIQNNAILFQSFEIANAKDQTAVIKGSINLGKDLSIKNDLNIRTEMMELMNSTQEDNDILFGRLLAQADISVKGDNQNVEVKSTVEIDQETELTYIFPDELSLNNNEGIVQFGKFNPDTLDDSDIQVNSPYFGFNTLENFNSTVNIDEGTRFKIFFDSGGENYLDASLNGMINYNMVENNSEISGMLEIEQGSLRYGIPMVNVDEYSIEPGSFLTLSNDIYNPYLNIIASSQVRASTEGLMATEPKVMEFKVLLNMVGELNDILVSFDISPETSDALVSSRIAQLTEQERNVNALNLLVRGSFLLSLQGDEIGGTSAMDAQIDKFYSDQLNHLIGENISFVDLKFDVESFTDYNTGGEQVTRRNYYYNIGKSFFNDRARINYKGSLDFTYQEQNEQVNSHFVQNELEFEVKITKDGRFRGVLFRKNQYEGLLEGEVIQTGGGLRYSKDYYSLRDFFAGKRKQESKNLKDPDKK